MFIAAMQLVASVIIAQTLVNQLIFNDMFEIIKFHVDLAREKRVIKQWRAEHAGSLVRQPEMLTSGADRPIKKGLKITVRYEVSLS
jgi:hypothetical protein